MSARFNRGVLAPLRFKVIRGLAEIDRCYDFFQTGTLRLQKKREAARQRLLSLLEERLVKKALEHAFPDGDLSRTVEEIADRKTDPYTVVDRIIKTMRFS